MFIHPKISMTSTCRGGVVCVCVGGVSRVILLLHCWWRKDPTVKMHIQFCQTCSLDWIKKKKEQSVSSLLIFYAIFLNKQISIYKYKKKHLKFIHREQCIIKYVHDIYPWINSALLWPFTLSDWHSQIPLMRPVHKVGQEGSAIIWCHPH